jgi:ATP synthase subunit 6
MYSPLEQFEINILIPIHLFGYDFSITNSTIFMLLAVTFTILLLQIITKNATLVPTRWQAAIEFIYSFVFNILYETVGTKGVKYFPLIFSIFMFILTCNLLGMIPYSFTVTSHIIVTFGLGFSIFLGITILGFQEHGLHYFSLLVPSGAPRAMIPALVVIETVSYIVKPISLSVRLFANMMAGHTLLKIIAGFGWSMFTFGGIFYFLGFIPMLILVLLVGLEFAIAGIQAYVFTLLVCSYLKDAIHLH